VRRPFQQALVDQPSQHAGQGARVDVEQARQLAGRHAWKQSDGADHQPLGPGYADCQEHPLRRPLQRVHQRPQHAHELQHVVQIVGALLRARPCSHASHYIGKQLVYKQIARIF